MPPCISRVREIYLHEDICGYINYITIPCPCVYFKINICYRIQSHYTHAKPYPEVMKTDNSVVINVFKPTKRFIAYHRIYLHENISTILRMTTFTKYN